MSTMPVSNEAHPDHRPTVISAGPDGIVIDPDHHYFVVLRVRVSALKTR